MPTGEEVVLIPLIFYKPGANTSINGLLGINWNLPAAVYLSCIRNFAGRAKQSNSARRNTTRKKLLLQTS